jgi:DNA-binding CsgD family transcriptional regulator
MSSITRRRPATAWTAAILAACTVALLANTVAEFLTPRELPLGTLGLLPVLVAALLVEPGPAVGVVILAAATRVFAAADGDTAPLMPLVDTASYVAALAIVVPLKSRLSRSNPETVSRADGPPVRVLAFPAAEMAGVELTAREREVLDMTLQGLTAAQVGERLFISKRTVETHLGHAYEKMGVRSKRDLAAWLFDKRVNDHSTPDA